MFRIELGKIVSNIVFYLCILATVVLLLSGTIYTDCNTGEEYSLVNIIINKNTELLNKADLHATDVIVSGVDSYLFMFLPIIVAVPFVMIVCGDMKNSTVRFEIYRVGKNRFLMGKFFASAISGGLSIMFGYMIFSIITYFTLPKGSGVLLQLNYDFFKNETTFGKWYFTSFGVPGMIILKNIRMFLLGFFASVPAFGLSRIIKNRYIVISIPFMFFYLFEKFVIKHENQLLYKALISNIGNVFDNRFLSFFTIFGGAALFIIVLCRIYLGRKCDCGEE